MVQIGKERPVMLGGKSFPVTARIRSILMEMYHCHFVGSLKKIFIEGKLLELLSLQVEQMTFKKSGNSTVLKKDDIERIHYVKELLLQNLSNPHSIQDLASLAGMNRTKLQHSFKEVFGNTIYGYLADERMNKAMGLLKEDNYVKIAEIARQIGYKNPNHFSVAFKKKFGYLPKDVKNTATAFS
ncbi:helix-turn-helix transcriptional regulator [Pedobacter sp. BS3]|nr:helix-turn-helix transcriptional regulator [Pedobacter sp. BS3]